MKKLIKPIIAIGICLIVFCGCSAKKKLAGVYMAKNVSTPNEAIILYEDGQCSYFGDKDTSWKAKNDMVTITKREPDTYCIDVYLDNSLSHAEMKAVGTRCNRIETVYSTLVIVDESKLRIEIIDQKDAEKTQELLSDVNGVTETEFIILPGAVYHYEFDIIDGCLVSSVGNVYIKQEN